MRNCDTYLFRPYNSKDTSFFVAMISTKHALFCSPIKGRGRLKLTHTSPVDINNPDLPPFPSIISPAALLHDKAMSLVEV
jgi:hypothetical protein